MRPTTIAAGQKIGREHFRTLWRMLPYLWPEGRMDLKTRVVVAVGLLIAAKLTNIMVPYLLREAVASPLAASGTALVNGWELYRADNGWLLRGGGTQLLVNGAVYTSGQCLCTGDEIALGAGRSALLITVES